MELYKKTAVLLYLPQVFYVILNCLIQHRQMNLSLAF